MNSNFKALILTHKQAGIQLREQVAMDAPTCQAMLAAVRELTGAADLLALSTCNRTEFYYSSEQDLSRQIITLLQLQKAIPAESTALTAFRQILDPAKASRHLFRVALGLEAQIPGDMQIIGQVKHAYQWSADAGAAGPYLHRLMHTIFFANKKVCSETSFRTGAASVAYAAQELAEELLPRGQASRLMVLGVGEMGANLCRNLTHEGYQNVLVLNRSQDKAEALAAECGITAGPLASLAQEAIMADAIISCVSAPEPVLTLDMLAGLAPGHRLLVFDLSVPRSVAPELEAHPGVLLYNMDDLEARATQGLESRLAEIPKVETIMEEALAEFADWSREMMVTPAIQAFKATLEQLRQEELVRALRQATPAEAELLERVTGALIQKIVKLPVLELKAACRRGEGEELAETLQALFNLERKKVG